MKSRDECAECVMDFDEKGGCKFWRSGNWKMLEQVSPHSGDPCYTCEKYAVQHCEIPEELQNAVRYSEDEFGGGGGSSKSSSSSSSSKSSGSGKGAAKPKPKTT